MIKQLVQRKKNHVNNSLRAVRVGLEEETFKVCVSRRWLRRAVRPCVGVRRQIDRLVAIDAHVRSSSSLRAVRVRISYDGVGERGRGGHVGNHVSSRQLGERNVIHGSDCTDGRADVHRVARLKIVRRRRGPGHCCCAVYRGQRTALMHRRPFDVEDAVVVMQLTFV